MYRLYLRSATWSHEGQGRPAGMHTTRVANRGYEITGPSEPKFSTSIISHVALSDFKHLSLRAAESFSETGSKEHPSITYKWQLDQDYPVSVFPIIPI